MAKAASAGTVEVLGTVPAAARVLTKPATAFLARLERRFGARRRELLEARKARDARWLAGERPAFLAETRSLRDGTWRVAPPPKDLMDRRVEITGPTDRKMMVNALNSGANVFMADFEDANAPTWSNLVEGQANLIDAVRRSLSLVTSEGKEYRLKDRVATLVVRPRGWHLDEKHLRIDGAPMSGSLFDAGLYVFHNAKEAAARGTGAYFYLPKLESHVEARLWNDVFRFCEAELGLASGSLRATVLIETIPAAFEMEEILYELRERSTGLNAGRWDYLFSIIKKFRAWKGLVMPDRSQLTMGVPFMRAYAQQIVRACHRRGAHAMGGMSAFIPNRRDPEVTEKAMANVRRDKEREVQDGCDGTWVAHPDLVELARTIFDQGVGSGPNQVHRLRDDVKPSAEALLDFHVEGGKVTREGLRNNVEVGLRYMESWLRGVGALAIHDLMEDAATAEIARSQVWLWLHRKERLADGATVTPAVVRSMLQEEATRLKGDLDRAKLSGRVADAVSLFERVALGEEFPEFLTVPGYAMME